MLTIVATTVKAATKKPHTPQCFQRVSRPTAGHDVEQEQRESVPLLLVKSPKK